MIWSLRLTLWSSGILRIDLERVIFQKSVVGILYGYSIFSAISFRVIDAWYSEFLIIGLLYYAQDYQGFLYLQYSGLFSECSTTRILLQSNDIRSVLFGIVQRLIQPEVQKISIFWLLFRPLESPTYSASYHNWYNFHPCPLCVQLTPYRNCEDAIFCKVDECNTPLPEYVLSCVFRFLDHIFLI